MSPLVSLSNNSVSKGKVGIQQVAAEEVRLRSSIVGVQLNYNYYIHKITARNYRYLEL
jgi:hypothetical protein